ncbi:hypothetical protein [Cellulomonas olei]|uniref:hypothetical protein n=1 Tax=Cellulomonas sp. P4 TaxID=3142533 RepID=UPI0031B9F567
MTRRLPGRFVPHGVLVRDLVGRSGTGPIYGPARDVERTFVTDERKLVRDEQGREVVSESQVVLDLDVHVALGSLVTVRPGSPDQREAKVIAVDRRPHRSGRRPLPPYQQLYLE